MEKKDFRTGLVIGAIFSGIIILAVFVWAFYFYIGIIDFGQGNLFSELISDQQEKAFERVAGYWQESELVESLAYVCSLQRTELEKVKCVHYYVNSTFRFVRHDERNKLRENPNKLLELGGVCRDYSVLYSSLMNNLNINYEIIYLSKHMYLMVYPRGYTCKLDMDKLNCTKN